MLAGFRWAEIRESLNGDEGVLDTTETIWDPVGGIKTNNLYGFQIGADAILLQRGCWTLDGIVKAGIFDNHAEQLTFSSNPEEPFSISDSTNHTAFLGEVGLQAKCQVTDCLTLKAGYQVLWFDGIALAPAQLTNISGIDTAGTIIFQGANAGLEYKF